MMNQLSQKENQGSLNLPNPTLLQYIYSYKLYCTYEPAQSTVKVKITIENV